MNRLDLFPISTRVMDNRLTIAGHDLTTLAEKHGTPLYVYDRATLDSAAVEYKSALASHYPGPASVTYAGKAFLNKAIAQWTQSRGLTVDCTGEGEIGIATGAAEAGLGLGQEFPTGTKILQAEGHEAASLRQIAALDFRIHA